MSDRQPLPLIVLASGGTGGHVFPAQALAEELQRRGHRLALVTDRRAAAFSGTLGRIEVHRIQAGAVSGRSIVGRIGALARLAMGFFQARRLLKRLQPAAVVGFGSYPSVPTVLAATMLSIPTVIHEQNAIFGRANRLLAPRVSRIATAFETVKTMRARDRRRAVRTGNPVRPAIVAMRDRPYPPLTDEGPIDLLVFGGSQGAAVFAEVVPAAIRLLDAPLAQRLRIAQQCREADIETARRGYRGMEDRVTLSPFFSDMPERLAAAQLVIARSGASTLAELTCVGRPAILVPYPHATDDHQKANAEELCDIGGGWMFSQDTFTPDALAQRLTSLLTMPRSIQTAIESARRLGVPDAAERLADVVGELVAANAVKSGMGGAA
ncbi:MAG: undecaprenyldiphospho-muramoylpentapeptide beta-N-acetylglucosaminyltransferase [Alphaproteobacteria bacterium]